MDLNLETAKAYSISAKVSLQWTMAALFIEEIVKVLSESELKDAYIIGGDYLTSSLIGSDYGVLPILEIYITNDKKSILLAIIKNAYSGITRITKASQSLFNQCEKEDYIIEGSLEGIRTSFTVKIKCFNKLIWDDRRPKELRGYTGLNRMDGVYCLCTEEILVDKLNNIISSGEIINNMRDYYDINRIITTINIDGHRLIECFRTLVVEPEQLIEEFEILSNNKNLHKRWRAWRRDNHLNEIDYIDIFDELMMIFTPLVSCYITKDVFFGEWVPELKRYIG